jgi:hypothetical protein
MPAIVCLQCATRWPNADAFWAAANAAQQPEAAETAVRDDEARIADGASGEGATSDAGPARS